jgi:hypothetical protein
MRYRRSPFHTIVSAKRKSLDSNQPMCYRLHALSDAETVQILPPPSVETSTVEVSSKQPESGGISLAILRDRERRRLYRIKNREKVNSYQRQWWNTEKVRNHYKQYYQKNKQRIKERGRAYYLKNRERISIRGKKYYKAHKARHLASKR